jgi:cellulose synthase/poly-beta-1,6-N-acetylglucosamine synthase-like glycosyltransferase/spore germination protein YaaH/peptidoglycan/xylan/chitin deacetylase (PgdA/CDA1 family)
MAATPGQAAAPPPITTGLSVGFYTPDSPSRAALEAEWNHLTHLAPVWMQLDHDGHLQAVTAAAGVGTQAVNRLVAAAHLHGVRVWPVLQNRSGGTLDTAGLKALGSESSRAELADGVADVVVSGGADGVSVDLQGLSQGQGPDLVAFVTQLTSTMHREGKEVVVDVPPDDPGYLYGQLSSASDWILLTAYDQHSADTKPGPVASLPWARDSLHGLLAEVPAQKVILGLGGYGYDWGPGGSVGVGYRDVLQRAPSADSIKWDANASAPWFRYTTSSGDEHTVWFADATALAIQAFSARSSGVAGTALWRIGDEDPIVWQAIGRDADRGTAPNLGIVTVDPGLGEHDSRAAGNRVVAWSPTNSAAVRERYLTLPSSFPAPTGLRAGTVALTFDDGPDPVWTPKILAILHRYGVHATFFVMGACATFHPDLVAQAYAAGNEVGNHSFTHASDLELSPAWRLSAETTATQRIIEGATGHAATMFRYPYTTQQAFPDANSPQAERASQLGYTEVGYGTSTDDWARPGVVPIVARALSNPDANVILMHDGGGDRSQTVAALPMILEGLRTRHLDAVPLGEAMGMSRAAAMPSVPGFQVDTAHALVTATAALASVGSVAWWLFIVATGLGFIRIILLGVMGILQWVRSRRSYPPYERLVSVVIPAHNEEKVIRRTLDSLMASDYRALEIIVVDDGSRDGTAAAVAPYPDQGIRLIQQAQSGKAAALTNGFNAAIGEVVVSVDADTLFTPTTISALAAPFNDPKVGAVCGNPKVGNRVNLLTRMQSLEYHLSINLDRRGYALISCITVVPGAVGAWRRSAILAVGGFPGNTVTEDMDATICVSRAGYRVVYAPKAIAYTEAPQTLRGLHGQRKRWSFGTLQVLWKHRRAAFSLSNGSLGVAGLPTLWVAVVLPFFWPLMYVAVAFSSLASWSLQRLWMLVVYNLVVVVFLGWALVLEREPLTNLLLVPAYVIYSQFLQVIALRAVVQALAGDRVGWNPVGRVGSASIVEPARAPKQTLARAPVAETV